MYDQMEIIGLAKWGFSIVISHEDSEQFEFWMVEETDTDQNGHYFVNATEHPFYRNIWTKWKNQSPPFSLHHIDDYKREVDEYWLYETDFIRLPEEVKASVLEQREVFIHYATMRYGLLNAISYESISDQLLNTLGRFAKVFEQTYTRFLDIQKAEAQAREAQIEAALERVRARSMAMHNSDELADAAEILYSEFNELGVTPFSCGYVINDDEKGEWKVWMTDAGTDSFKDFWTLPYNADHHLLGRYESWQKGEAFHETILEGEENLMHHKIITKYSPWKASSLENLPSKLVLSSANFKFGHLLIVYEESLTEEQQDILCRFAKVFEQTYTRFLDLKTAEQQADMIKQEKERLEQTLTELKATQSQLVQAEKMASLGELTAGIAHEIQNPLNFVNNFSDVSSELLEEAIEELDNKDIDEAKEILEDLKGNLEKISHHGVRASSIVKGMLDHSRESSGEKELTDINALSDEYIRLSYHGLRAKDKSFNADFKLDLDENLPKIKVIPQDIGRVLLNILNNAFYAVDQKSKKGLYNGDGPIVRIKTHLSPFSSSTEAFGQGLNGAGGGNEEAIQITITDNGTGMSQETQEKVFQPFFTTKPTGQGTGLGMSISYDIITKGHQGSIDVRSKEGEGSAFVITLPKTDK